jgi:hypothetical protein
MAKQRFEVIQFYAEDEPANSILARGFLTALYGSIVSDHDDEPLEEACGHKHHSLNAAKRCAREKACGMTSHGSPSARVEEIHEDGSRTVVHTVAARGCRVTFC